MSENCTCENEVKEVVKVDTVTMITYLSLAATVFLMFLMKICKFFVDRKKLAMSGEKIQLLRSTSAQNSLSKEESKEKFEV